MSTEKIDAKLKCVEGKVKEAVGKLADDKEKEFEGKTEQVIGSVRENAEKAKDKAIALKDQLEEKAEHAKDTVKDVVSGIEHAFQKEKE
ncbi:hypothetical protein B6K86_05930 [Lachnospiraceae bacterium]|nr:hypothetical protein B6K86_05930 [Lachnospiraceae bacterium]